MGVAEGKDLVDMTDPTLGWEACYTCLNPPVVAGIWKGLGAVDDADVPGKLAAKMAKGKSIHRDVRQLCKNMWTYFSADAEKAASFLVEKRKDPYSKKVLTHSELVAMYKGQFSEPEIEDWWTEKCTPVEEPCPDAWRQSDDFAADVQEYCNTNPDDVMAELAFAYAAQAFRTLNAYCPASKRPLPAKVDDAKLYTQLVMNSASTRADIARLSAFTSLIAENDGMNAMGYDTSNYHNVFFSPLHATGIDMAVGGAVNHGTIKPGTSGKFDPTTSEVLGSFNYAEVTKAAHLGTCGTEEELEEFSGKYWKRILRPYSGDREHNYKQCAASHGHTAPLPELIQHSVEILRAWPDAMKHILDHAGAAIAAVRTEFSAPNAELADAIQAFLDLHLEHLTRAYDEGIQACAQTK
jgi:hypothetical protein